MPTFIINKGSSNIVCPTLVEKTTLSPVYYLWVITNDETLQKVYTTATEQSTQLQRYNKFTLVEKTSPNPLNGELELPTGQHKYEIYEIGSIPANLSTVNYTILNLVEQGIIKVPDSITNTEYTGASITDTVMT